MLLVASYLDAVRCLPPGLNSWLVAALCSCLGTPRLPYLVLVYGLIGVLRVSLLDERKGSYSKFYSIVMLLS